MTRSRLRPTLLLSALGLWACGDAQPSPRAAAAAADPFCAPVMARVDSFMAASSFPGEPPRGTAVVGHVSELVDGMNAFATIDYAANQFHQFVNLMTLIRVNRSLEPEGYLAESFEMSEDGTEVTFRLRDDVFWHDGERTDAHDVAFTYIRATDPETAFPNSAFWDQYVRGPEGVEVVDDFTVTVRMRPHAQPLDPWRTLGIMPEHLLGDTPPTQLRQHPFGSLCPVGNGPFVFQSHRAGESWSFEANPAFPEGLGGPPGVARLVYQVIPDQSILLAELLSGGVDMALTTTPDQARLILEDEDTELEVSDAREFTFIGWNTRRPQLSDQRVRQALAMAIDRQGLVETLLRGEGVNEEYGRVAETGVPPYHWAHDANLRGPAYDTVAAREQLTRAGWRDRDGDGVRENVQGVPLRLEILVSAGNATRETVAGFVEAQLGKVGVEVDVQPREPTELARRVTGAEVRDFDGVVLAWVPEFRVDEKNLFHSAREQGPMAFAGIRDVELDALLDTLPLISDREEALPLWSAYQERIIDLQPFTYLFYPRKLVGRSSRLEGVEVDYRGELLTVHDWRKADADGR